MINAKKDPIGALKEAVDLVEKLVAKRDDEATDLGKIREIFKKRSIEWREVKLLSGTALSLAKVTPIGPTVFGPGPGPRRARMEVLNLIFDHDGVLQDFQAETLGNSDSPGDNVG